MYLKLFVLGVFFILSYLVFFRFTKEALSRSFTATGLLFVFLLSARLNLLTLLIGAVFFVIVFEIFRLLKFSQLHVYILVFSSAFFSFLLGLNSSQHLLLLFFLLQFNDSFSLIFGKRFGKIKLFKEISPHKSLEGYLGGVLGICMGLILSKFYVMFNPFTLTENVILFFIIFIFGNGGDLYFSYIKRKVKVKDFSALLPGHGGVLDRFDSFVLSVPFFYLLIKFF